MKPWDYVEEMLKDETTKAKLIEWAVKFAEGKTDRESAMRACKQVCVLWRQTITRPVMDQLEQQIKVECAVGINRHNLEPDDEGNYRTVDCGVKVVSGHSLLVVIQRYNLEPDDAGNDRITDEMVDEAEALDKENDVTEKGLRFITTTH